MVILSTNKRTPKKKWEKIVCTKMMMEKNVCGDVCVYKNVSRKKIFHSPFQKNNGRYLNTEKDLYC